MSELSREIIITGSLKHKDCSYDLISMQFIDENWEQKRKPKHRCIETDEPVRPSEYYEFSILDNKLYLQNIFFDFCYKEVYVAKELFDNETIFCNRVSGIIKCFIELERRQIDSKRVMIIDKFIFLEFLNGVFIDEKRENEESIHRVPEGYVEE